MSQSRRETILVVDDQKQFADLVQRSLRQEGYDVIIAADGRSGLRIALEHKPDLVVLDLTLPDLDGLDVCRQLRDDPRAGKVPVIVLSARASENDRVSGLDAGADDYLIKPFGPNELLARVRAALRRARMDRPERSLVRSGQLEIDLLNHQVRYGETIIPLRSSEYRVLGVLASAPGRVFSRDEIIESALQRDSSVTERTVDVHITRIRQSLGGDGGDRIETVKGLGYRLRTDA